LLYFSAQSNNQLTGNSFMKKIRLDQLLVQKELAENVEMAQRLIRAGKVRLKTEALTKPGLNYSPEAEITIVQPDRFVSRGGDKLLGAMDEWGLRLDGAVCMDVGSSTGGFTDCMLQHGAVKVYAIDVGKGLLDWGLRKDERVVVMEEVNARYLATADFAEKPDFASIDTSFISLTKILPPLKNIIKPGGHIMSLIKPQFEARREQVGKGGVVRDPDVHDEVIEKVKEFGTKELGFKWLGVCTSPIKGPAGNIEFLAYWEVQ
jgi:23S rRNA (cytidine1920-2'-O)/16S rRNA (cytidine1409-2'-O)-methyltransferase